MRDDVMKLSTLPLFVDVPLAEVAALCAATEIVVYRAGDRIFAEGEPADRALLLFEGRLDAAVGGALTQQGVGEAGPGEVVGETALLSRGRRGATVFALTDARCLVLTPQLMRDHGRTQAVAAIERSLLASMARRIRETNRSLHQLREPPPRGGSLLGRAQRFWRGRR